MMAAFDVQCRLCGVLSAIGKRNELGRRGLQSEQMEELTGQQLRRLGEARTEVSYGGQACTTFDSARRVVGLARRTLVGHIGAGSIARTIMLVFYARAL